MHRAVRRESAVRKCESAHKGRQQGRPLNKRRSATHLTLRAHGRLGGREVDKLRSDTTHLGGPHPGGRKRRASSWTLDRLSSSTTSPVTRSRTSTRISAPHLAFSMSPARYLPSKCPTHRRYWHCAHSGHRASRHPRHLPPRHASVAALSAVVQQRCQHTVTSRTSPATSSVLNVAATLAGPI